MPTTKIKAKIKTPKPLQAIPSLVDMLEAGVHFGHERSKKNPKMDNYIFMLRNRMAIIDLEKTQAALAKACDFIHQIASTPGKEILFVGTKRQTREIIKKYAEATQMPYVTQRWLGGMLTNFSTVLKSIEKLEELKSMTTNEAAMEKMTKKERSVHMKSIERLEKVLEGTKNLKKPPAALIVVGSYDEKLAVREAARVRIPVVAVTDTNADPSLVDYPIPANDDAIRAIDLIVNTLAVSILKAQGKPTAALNKLLVTKLAPVEAASPTDEASKDVAK